MRLKRPEKNKVSQIRARCSTAHLHAIQGKANLYTEGNLSEWVIYAAMNYVPSRDEFEPEIKTPAQRRGKIKR